jgi:hypothetical protein
MAKVITIKHYQTGYIEKVNDDELLLIQTNLPNTYEIVSEEQVAEKPILPEIKPEVVVPKK